MQKRLKILVTGGPTRAYLDDVRYISNYSTGALSWRLCGDLSKAKYKVAAVIGPTGYEFASLNLDRLVNVETNIEMYQAVLSLCRSFKPDIVIFSAAVLDFAPRSPIRGKVSSGISKWKIELLPAPKIIDQVGVKFPKISRIGFKLQIDRLSQKGLERFAFGYLKKKRLDALCVNFRGDIDAKGHRAYLFGKDRSYKEVSDKAGISKGLRHFIKTGSFE
jgi:phosphopantothenoylcysteine decarboxylase / phosphopantothenate---cysteine ligase